MNETRVIHKIKQKRIIYQHILRLSTDIKKQKMNPQMDRRKDLSMNQEKSTNLSNIQTQKIKEDIVNRI